MGFSADVYLTVSTQTGGGYYWSGLFFLKMPPTLFFPQDHHPPGLNCFDPYKQKTPAILWPVTNVTVVTHVKKILTVSQRLTNR